MMFMLLIWDNLNRRMDSRKLGTLSPAPTTFPLQKLSMILGWPEKERLRLDSNIESKSSN